MTNKELRRKKLTDLIAQYGSQKAFGDAVGKDPAMFSQILNGTRNLGDKQAIELEVKLGKHRGWFDTPDLSSAGKENAELVGVSGFFKPIPVSGTAKLGVDGDYSFEQVEPGTVLDVPTKDVDACALRVVGDSMHPAIRHGWYVVIEPSVDPKNGLYVAVEMLDGRRMVKELLGMDADYIRLESVNPAHGRVTVESKDIKTIQAVTMIVQASKARMVV
jgi:phage repressor protein C with HTH and peptisase S24 domain